MSECFFFFFSLLHSVYFFRKFNTTFNFIHIIPSRKAASLIINHISCLILNSTLIFIYFIYAVKVISMSPFWETPKFMGWMQDSSWQDITNLDHWGTDQVIRYLARDPMVPGRHLQCNAVPLSSIQPQPPFDLGTLSILPLEIISYILSLTDLNTLQEFGMTNHYALFQTRNQVDFRLLRRVAPLVFPLLKLTGLARHHTISSVAQELRYPNCRSCGQRGTLLCLPTCERICENCAELNSSYWPISLGEAALSFALQPDDVNDFPVMFTSRRLWKDLSSHERLSNSAIVPVKAAYLTGLKRWKSPSALEEAAEALLSSVCNGADAIELSRSRFYQFLRTEQLNHPEGDRSQVAHRSLDTPRTKHHGYVTTLFPWVPQGRSTPIPLYICSGCGVVCRAPFNVNNREHLLFMGIDPSASTAQDGKRIIRGRSMIARTLEDLMHHIQHECLGAKLLMYRRYVVEQSQSAEVEST